MTPHPVMPGTLGGMRSAVRSAPTRPVIVGRAGMRPRALSRSASFAVGRHLNGAMTSTERGRQRGSLAPARLPAVNLQLETGEFAAPSNFSCRHLATLLGHSAPAGSL